MALAAGLHTVIAEFLSGSGNAASTYRPTQNVALWPNDPTVLPEGLVGVLYSYIFNGSWTIHELLGSDEAMRPPDGLTLDENTSEIFGTPTKTGTWYFQVDLRTQGAGARSSPFKLTISEIEFPASKLPDGVKYVPYSEHIITRNFKPGDQCETSSTLPIGLSLDSDGTLSGIPMAVGTWKFPVVFWNPEGSEPWEEFFELTIQSNTETAVQKAQ